MAYQTKNVRRDQRGFASIVIALVLIILLALLTVAFAQLARREQQSALNKQLATQANYAAESGINDIIKILPSIPVDNDPTKCYHPDPADTDPTTIGNPLKGVSYTCVLVNKKPPNIKWDNIMSQGSKHLQFSTDNPLSSFTINWGSASASPHTTFPTAAASGLNLQPLNTWNVAGRAGVLQVSITPLTALDRTSLINNTFTVYLYPASDGASSAPYTSASTRQGPILSGDCSTAINGSKYPCKSTIISLGSGTGPYLIHIINYYDSSNVLITGKCNGVTLQPCEFEGQPQIDSTAQAKNVLQRLQVRVPDSASSDVPDDAIEAQNLCKRFETYPGVATPQPPGSSADASCNLD
ncbi:MAG: PilX N-terminal domain-containing pilus assembly protein [Candidatus Saccharimonadales bacterium]